MNGKLFWHDKPYHSLDYDLKEKYGEKVYKIALDAGMTCPNRDGTCGVRGCIFCSAGGSGDFAIPDIVGISIATRPDCLDSDILFLLEKLRREYAHKFIWIELGLQTIHEKTAAFIRRGYTLPVFETAIKNLKNLCIPIIAHVIIGLPGEDKKQMLETCQYLAARHVDGIKLQLLHVLKNTDLVELYKKKTFEILSIMEYIDIVISCIEILPPDMVIHRVTGDGPRNLLLAPLWSLDKRRVLNTLHQQMKQRNTYQSRLYV